MKNRQCGVEFYSRENISYATTVVKIRYFYNFISEIIFERILHGKGKEYKSFLFEDNIKLQKAWIYVVHRVR